MHCLVANVQFYRFQPDDIGLIHTAWGLTDIHELFTQTKTLYITLNKKEINTAIASTHLPEVGGQVQVSGNERRHHVPSRIF